MEINVLYYTMYMYIYYNEYIMWIKSGETNKHKEKNVHPNSIFCQNVNAAEKNRNVFNVNKKNKWKYFLITHVLIHYGHGNIAMTRSCRTKS